jgi:hypothetical protein
MKHNHLTLLLILIVGQTLTSFSFASEFRAFRPILTPMQSQPGGKAVPARQLKPVSRQAAEKAVNKLLTAWNGKNLDQVLGDEFYDKSRLNDAMGSKVPRDAELSLLAIQDTQTLQQQVVDSPSGKLLVSTISVTARTQLTFNDPTAGYQRREGVNEYIMRIRQRL